MTRKHGERFFPSENAARSIRAAHAFGKMFPPLPWEVASLPTKRYWQGGERDYDLPSSALEKKRIAALVALGHPYLESAMKDDNAPTAVKEYVRLLQLTKDKP